MDMLNVSSWSKKCHCATYFRNKRQLDRIRTCNAQRFWMEISSIYIWTPNGRLSCQSCIWICKSIAGFILCFEVGAKLIAPTANHINLRDRNSFQHYCQITKPFGRLDVIIDWCKTELQGDWRWELLQASTDIAPGQYGFYFDTPSDHCAFVLKWG